LACKRFEIRVATVVMLVALRLVIGWHFFKEGVSHHNDPTWSSEGFLRQAKGPLADAYRSVLPDFHGWNRLMLAPLPDDAAALSSTAEAQEPAAPAPAKPTTGVPDGTKGTEYAGGVWDATKGNGNGLQEPEKPTAYHDWLAEVKRDWAADEDRISSFYHFDEQQKKKADEILKDAERRLKDYLDESEPDIRLYRQLVARAQRMQQAPGTESIPNQQARAAAAAGNPLGEKGISGHASPLATTPAAWQSGARAIEQLYHDRLDTLVTADQRKLGSPPAESSRLQRVDAAVAWLLMAVGACLVLGLFTRLAAVGGCCFLLSVICTQPPWLPGAIITYNQTVELVALVMLITTPVGRWGGLDYFIHRIIFGGSCKASGPPAEKQA